MPRPSESFDFQRSHARIQQTFQIRPSVHVFQRKQVAALFYHTPVTVYHIELQPAELGALSPIGTPPEAMLRHVALSAVTDTERPVYKDLQRHVASLMHG